MRDSWYRPSEDSGRSLLFVVVCAVCVIFVLGGYSELTDFLLSEASGDGAAPSRRTTETRGDSQLEHAERSVQRQIDRFIEKHGRNPRDLHEVKKGLVARLHESLPQSVDVEYNAGTGKIRVFEVDPFDAGPTEYSVFGAATPPESRAAVFAAFLGALVEDYRERHDDYPEDPKDAVQGIWGRGFRLPLGYRIDYDRATGEVKVVPDDNG